ncbi:MAG: hypothetical protein P4L40_07640 [Terracidiphilus sp.]|nr:hypothetical protein [Terracidiphilus sp.]
MCVCVCVCVLCVRCVWDYCCCCGCEADNHRVVLLTCDQEPALAGKLLGAITAVPVLIDQALAIVTSSSTAAAAITDFLSEAGLAAIAFAVFGGEFVATSVGSRVSLGGKEDGTLLGVDPEAGLAVVATDADPTTPTRVPVASVIGIPTPVPRELTAAAIGELQNLLPALLSLLSVGTGKTAPLFPSRLPNPVQAIVADLQVRVVCVCVHVCVSVRACACVCVCLCCPCACVGFCPWVL